MPRVSSGKLLMHPAHAHAHPLSAGMPALSAPDAVADTSLSLTRGNSEEEILVAKPHIPRIQLSTS